MNLRHKEKQVYGILTSIFFVALVLLAADFSFSKAQVATSQLNVSAYLIDSEKGTVSNGEYDVRFAIYTADRTTIDQFPSDSDGGKRVWQETQKISLRDGILNAYLGSETPLPAALNFSSGEYYLGIRIGNDSEMVPRKKIGAVPTAINSSFLNGAKAGNSAGDLVELGKGGKIDTKLISTGSGSSQLVIGNDNRLHNQNTDTGTDSNSFVLGQGVGIDGNNFNLFVSGNSSNPSVQFNGTAQKWQISNDGSTFSDILTLSPQLSGAGTGISPFSIGDILYFENGGFAPLGIGNQGEILTVENGLPKWMPIIPNPKHNLLSDTHLDAETAGVVRGDLITAQGASTKWSRLAIGASGAVLKSDGTDILWSVFSKSDIGLGNVENTALSTWTGSANIANLGTITSGIWNGNMITSTYLTSNVMVEGERIGLLFNDSGYITASTTDTLTNKTWNGNLLGYAYGGLNSNVSAGNGFVKISGGATSFVADNSTNWNNAYSHSIATGNPHGLTKTDLGIANVENTAISSWAGTTNVTTLGTIASGTWNGSVISTGFGGTGLATYTAGDMLYYSSGSAMNNLAIGINGQVLTVSSGVPTWTSSAPATPHNILSVQHSDSTAGTVVRGDLLSGQGVSPSWSRLALGVSGTVLKSDGSDVVWSTLGKIEIGLGNVENTALSTWAGTTNITTLGTIASGTWNATPIDALHGGTGVSSYTAGDMLYYSSGSNLTKLGIGLNGQVLIISSGVPTWTSSAPASPHNFLSVQHSDVTPATAQRGDIITAQGVSPSWSRLALGIGGTFLKSDGTDSVWSSVSKSDVGLGSVENTALSTWAGTTNIASLGTVTIGTWNGSLVNSSYLASNVMVEGENISLFNNNSGYITASSIDTLTNKTWNGNLLGYAYGGLNSNVSAGNGFVKISGGATSFVTDNSADWNSAAFHSTIIGNPHGTTKTEVGLGNVENTALSTWAGTTNITTLGTITSGTWNGSIVDVAHGGTGTSNGSITGSGALAFAAGGTNQNVTLTPSGTGYTILGGNVGIGMATPSAHLQLSGTASQQFLAFSGNGTPTLLSSMAQIIVGDDATFQNGQAILHVKNQGNRGNIGNASGSDLLRLDFSDAVAMLVNSNGNVGIGTATPTSGFKLDVNGDIYISEATPRLYAANNFLLGSDSGTMQLYTNKDTAGEGIKMTVQNATGVDMDVFGVTTAANTANAYFLNSNVGIGINEPQTKLDVYGGINVLPTYGYGIGMTSILPNGVGGMYHTNGLTSGFTSLFANLGGVQIGVEGKSAAVTILKTSGNVGIGTASPSKKLEIYDGDLAINSPAFGNIWFGNDSAGAFIDKVGSTTAIENIRIQTSKLGDGTNYSQFIIDPTSGFSFGTIGTGNGNVGIGTAAPDSKLNVFGNVNIENAGGTGNLLIADAGNHVNINAQNDWTYMSLNGLLTITPTYFILGGNIASNLVPYANNTYNLGSATNYWNNTYTNNLYTSGNVGIGTTSPTTKLAIANDISGYTSMQTFDEIGNSGSNSMGIDFRFGGLSGFPWGSGVRIEAKRPTTAAEFDLAFHTYGSGALSEKMRILSGGNVGIGTTSPSQKLDIAGNVALSTGGYIYGDTTNQYLRLSSVIGSVLAYNSDNFFQVGNGSMIFRAAGNERIRLDSNGNVGIGTSAPSLKTEIYSTYGAPATSGTTPNGNLALTTSDVYESLYFGISSTLSGTDYPAWIQASRRNDLSAIVPLLLNPRGGNVGIGTINPTKTLDINKDGATFQLYNSAVGGTGNFYLGSRQTAGDSKYFGIIHKADDATNGSLYFIPNSVTTSAATVTMQSSGNVGIGTENPLYPLQISGTNVASYYPLALSSSVIGTVGNTVGMRFGYTGDTYQKGAIIYESISSDGVGKMHFAMDATPNGDNAVLADSKVTILSSGNVGIGATTPTDKLEVNGNVFADAFNSIGGVTRFNSNGGLFVSGYAGSSYGEIRAYLDVLGTAKALALNPTGGNVGIGTTTPVAKLEVKGGGYAMPASSGVTQSDGLVQRLNDSSDAVLDIGGAAGNGMWLQSVNRTSLSSNLPLLLNPNGGNVGIGNTSPSAKVEVYSSTASSRLKLTNSTSGSGVALGLDIQKEGLGAYLWNFDDGPMFFGTNNTGRLTIGNGGDFDFNTNQLYIKQSTARVGIGTNAPSQKLDVEGNIAIKNAGFLLSDDTVGAAAGYYGVVANANQIITGSVANDLVIRNSQSILFSANAGVSTQMSILNGGNVGIGTASPLKKLSIEVPWTAGTITPFVSAQAGAYTLSSINSINEDIVTSDTGMAFDTMLDGVISEKMRITSSGNVGIGTTSPVSGLHVSGTAGTAGFTTLKHFNALKLGVPTSSEYGGQAQFWIGRYEESSNNARTALTISLGHGQVSSHNADADVDVMTLLSNGNVGIGTTSPVQSLDVSGNIRQRGGTLENSINTNITANAYYNGGWKYRADGYATNFYTNQTATGDTYFYTAGSGIADGAITWTNALKIANNGNITLPSGALTVTGVGNTTIAGNVGIGVTSPGAMLQVGTAAAGGNVRVDNGWLCVDNNGSCTGATTAGTVYAVGAYTTGADYAEYFYTKDTDLKSGEAVCVDPNNDNAIKRCQNDGDNDIMGIVSSNPSIVGNKNHGDDPNYKIIGMIGQVSGLVSAENGPIKTGDSLTASIKPGYMRKANAGESTVGIAMQNLASGKGSIQILISRRNKSLTVEKVEEAVAQNIASMDIQDQVNQFVDDAKTTLASQISSQGAVLAAMQLQLDDSLVLSKKLELQMADLEARINPELTIAKVDLNSQDISYLKLLLGVDKVKNPGDIEILGKLKAQIIEGNKLVISVVDDASRTVGKSAILKIETDADNDNIDDKTGSDGKKIRIKTNAVSVDSKIFVTPKITTDQPLAVTDIKEGESFSVSVKNVVDEDLPFDWFIVEEK